MDRIYVMQLVRSFQVGQLDRRAFLKKASVALGSVAAANMLLAACAPAAPAPEAEATPLEGDTSAVGPVPTEETPPPVVVEETTEPAATEEAPEGLATEMVDYEDTDGELLMGYLARPAEAEPLPAIVVIQEWWGLNEHIKDVTRRFAQEGYVALAPDLYHGAVTSEPDEARKLVMELDMAEAVSEIQRAIDYLQNQEYVAAGPVGLVGFCMGGGLTLQTALQEEDLGAAVPFYGRPLSPEEAARVKAPVMGHFGANDGGIPVEAVQEMESGFEEGNIEHEIFIYEGAPHAFFNDTRDSYRPEAAAQAWERTLNWFNERLKNS